MDLFTFRHIFLASHAMVNLAVMKPADVLAQLSKSDTLLWEISERIWEKQARRRHGAHLFKFEE